MYTIEYIDETLFLFTLSMYRRVLIMVEYVLKIVLLWFLELSDSVNDIFRWLSTSINEHTSTFHKNIHIPMN